MKKITLMDIMESLNSDDMDAANLAIHEWFVDQGKQVQAKFSGGSVNEAEGQMFEVTAQFVQLNEMASDPEGWDEEDEEDEDTGMAEETYDFETASKMFTANSAEEAKSMAEAELSEYAGADPFFVLSQMVHEHEWSSGSSGYTDGPEDVFILKVELDGKIVWTDNQTNEDVIDASDRFGANAKKAALAREAVAYLESVIEIVEANFEDNPEAGEASIRVLKQAQDTIGTGQDVTEEWLEDFSIRLFDASKVGGHPNGGDSDGTDMIAHELGDILGIVIDESRVDELSVDTMKAYAKKARKSRDSHASSDEQIMRRYQGLDMVAAKARREKAALQYESEETDECEDDKLEETVVEESFDDLVAELNEAFKGLETVSDKLQNVEGAQVGEEGKVSVNTKATLPSHKGKDRLGGEPVEVKGKGHTGHALEKAPKVADVKVKNTVQNGKEELKKVADKGDASALLNKKDGKENTQSPISGKGAKGLKK